MGNVGGRGGRNGHLWLNAFGDCEIMVTLLNTARQPTKPLFEKDHTDTQPRIKTIGSDDLGDSGEG